MLTLGLFPVWPSVLLQVDWLTLLLLILWVMVKEPDASCRFELEEGVGTRRDFFVVLP